MIDNYDNVDEIGVEKLMEFIQGPGFFLTGRIIVGTGKGDWFQGVPGTRATGRRW